VPAAAGGGGSLTNFSLVLAPGQGPFSTIEPYGPYDEITVETGTISPGGAYSTLLSSSIGPSSYLVNVGTIDIDATYSACNTMTLSCTTGAGALHRAPARHRPRWRGGTAKTPAGSTRLRSVWQAWLRSQRDPQGSGDPVDIRIGRCG
jgi:hypothetical protein